MDIIEVELKTVREYILRDFSELFPEGKLEKFLMSEQAKYIRSILAILFLKAHGVVLNGDIYNLLAAGEIVHAASLLHDDVIDDADMRRGELAFAKLFSPHLSVLAGDYLLFQAMNKLSEIDSKLIVEKFEECAKQMIRSEVRQYFLRNKKTLLDEYLEICKGKTGGLFGVILESAAELSGLDTGRARDIGETFGVLFQIRNDLNRVSAEADVRNGVMTARDILGIEKTISLSDNYKKDIRELIKDIPDNVYKSAIEEIIESNV